MNIKHAQVYLKVNLHICSINRNDGLDSSESITLHFKEPLL